MRKVLIDASSAILLFKADLFQPLIQYYHTRMAEAVFQEITPSGYPGANFFKELYRLEAFDSLQPDHQAESPLPDVFKLPNMGKGEHATLLLFHQHRADFIIIDDYRGARYCRDNSFPYINALLFPKILLSINQLSADQSQAKIDYLQQIGRYSSKIITYARNLPPKALQPFLPDP